MEIRDADIVGESGYNDMLEETCRILEESGVAVRSEGALCVFFDDVKGPDGNPVPLIVQKSNGGYGYAATDLSAIRDRVGTSRPTPCCTSWTPGSPCTSRWSSRRPAGPAG